MKPHDIAKTLGQFPTATIYEAAGKCGDMGPDIRKIVLGVSLSGIAYTVRTFPSDTTLVGVAQVKLFFLSHSCVPCSRANTCLDKHKRNVT